MDIKTSIILWYIQQVETIISDIIYVDNNNLIVKLNTNDGIVQLKIIYEINWTIVEENKEFETTIKKINETKTHNIVDFLDIINKIIMKEYECI